MSASYLATLLRTPQRRRALRRRDEAIRVIVPPRRRRVPRDLRRRIGAPDGAGAEAEAHCHPSLRGLVEGVREARSAAAHGDEIALHRDPADRTGGAPEAVAAAVDR